MTADSSIVHRIVAVAATAMITASAAALSGCAADEPAHVGTINSPTQVDSVDADMQTVDETSDMPDAETSPAVSEDTGSEPPSSNYTKSNGLNQFLNVAALDSVLDTDEKRVAFMDAVRAGLVSAGMSEDTSMRCFAPQTSPNGETVIYVSTQTNDRFFKLATDDTESFSFEDAGTEMPASLESELNTGLSGGASATEAQADAPDTALTEAVEPDSETQLREDAHETDN